MHRLVILAAAGLAALSGLSSADAAARHKHKIRPAVTQAVPAVQPVARRPVWAAPWQCFTDDGYGRYLPCDVGDGR